MTIAGLIRDYRHKNGLTQIQLADRIGRTPRSIKRYEKGQTLPTIETLSKIFIGDVLWQIMPIYIKEVLHHE